MIDLSKVKRKAHGCISARADGIRGVSGSLLGTLQELSPRNLKSEVFTLAFFFNLSESSRQ